MSKSRSRHMVRVEVSVNDPEARDQQIADLWEAGTCGIQEDGDRIVAYFHDSGDLRKRFPQAQICDEIETTSAWESPPAPELFLVGEQFVVTECDEREAPAGRHRIVVPHTAAFGSGRHESTQLGIAMLERVAFSGGRLLDVGCGSGILAEAGRVLGMRVIGCDTDENSLYAARLNFQHLPVFFGSADGVEKRSFDIVVANIGPRVLDELSAELRRVTRRDGFILVSGFYRSDPPANYKPEHVLELDGWLCWACRPDQVSGDDTRPVQPFRPDWY